MDAQGVCGGDLCLITSADLQWEGALAGGSFGDVRKARLKRTGERVAVKTCRGTDEEGVNVFREEARLLGTLHHFNITNVLGGHLDHTPTPHVVMEYYPRGTLHEVLHGQHSTTPNLRVSVRLALDIARSLRYLHTLPSPLVHRDVKPLNVMVTRDWHSKLADFGLARMVPPDGVVILTSGRFQGTPEYAAPEVLAGDRYTPASDVFSLGMTLWEIMTGTVPFGGMDAMEVAAVRLHDPSLRPPWGEHMKSGTVRHLIEGCWDTDPGKRLSLDCVIDLLEDLEAKAEAELQEKSKRQDAKVAALEKALRTMITSEVSTLQPKLRLGLEDTHKLEESVMGSLRMRGLDLLRYKLQSGKAEVRELVRHEIRVCGGL